MSFTCTPHIQVTDAENDLAEIAKYVDILNVMTFSLHGYNEGYTHHHSPLFAYLEDMTDKDKKLNVVSFFTLDIILCQL